MAEHDPLHLAYLAGIIDADGHISIGLQKDRALPRFFARGMKQLAGQRPEQEMHRMPIGLRKQQMPRLGVTA